MSDFRPRGAWLALLAVGALALSASSVASAAFPGRNGRIAYEGAEPGGPTPLGVVPAVGVYTIRPDGTGRRWILRDQPISPYLLSPTYTEPAYAPRGARIAFVRSTSSALGPDRLIGSIWIARSDGSHRRELVSAGPYGSVSSPQWAPDGRAIVFFRDPCGAYNQGDYLICPPDVFRPSQSGLFVYRRGRIRLLTHNGELAAWSPTGRRIAFVSEGELYVIRPDASGRRRIFNKRFVGSVDWSPDGRRLLIGYHRPSAGWRVATIRPDGRGFRRLSRGQHPAYSPDGRQIVFEHSGFLMTMRADATRQRRIRLPSGKAIDHFGRAAWQPLP
jgi:TolB protein